MFLHMIEKLVKPFFSHFFHLFSIKLVQRHFLCSFSPFFKNNLEKILPIFLVYIFLLLIICIGCPLLNCKHILHLVFLIPQTQVNPPTAKWISNTLNIYSKTESYLRKRQQVYHGWSIKTSIGCYIFIRI